MNYDKCIEELNSPKIFRIELGLNRIKKVLKYLGDPQDKLEYIHVAGTNGKGSVCAIVDSILREAGYKTGLYTSPHIFDYTERIKFCGNDISKSDFAKYFDKVTTAKNLMHVDLTEFEILTIIMFLYFKDVMPDVVILETGMGGRFDATNVIYRNLCSVITKIDLDHTDRLGNTREEIAFEKAGIIKKGCPIITSMGYEAIKDKAEKMDSLLVFVSPNVDNKYIEALALKGYHQIENLALAITAINLVFPSIKSNNIINGLKKVKNPYRFEYFKDKNLIIDVCHNPDGIQVLRKNLDLMFPNEQRRFVFGCLNTKDYSQMINILFREGDEIYFNEFDYHNACTFEELNLKCPYSAKRYDKYVKLSKDKLNVICGSFYMLRGLLRN